MALTENINESAPAPRQLKHKYVPVTDGALTSLITGLTGRRIRIWRLQVYAAASPKTCAVLSGSNPFPSFDTTKSELKSSDGIPVYVCNAGEDFKADPSDTTAWSFYMVYSIT